MAIKRNKKKFLGVKSKDSRTLAAEAYKQQPLEIEFEDEASISR